MHPQTLFLHIGRHKTATTSIQMFLHKNSRTLLKHFQVLYPVTGRKGGPAHHNLASSVRRNPHPKFPPEKSFQEYLEELSKEVGKNRKAKSVVLSSEVFTEAPDLKTLQEIESYFPNLKIILYLRRQDQMLESVYSEFIMTGNAKDSMEEWRKKYNKEELNHNALVTKFAVIFGAEKIMVRPFEKVQLFHQDIIKDFLKIIGIESYDRFIELERVYNPANGVTALKVMRFLNQSGVPMKDKTVFLRTLRALYQDESKNSLTPENANALIDHFAPLNDLIAKHFLNGQEHLFLEPKRPPQDPLQSQSHSEELSSQQWADMVIKLWNSIR